MRSQLSTSYPRVPVPGTGTGTRTRWGLAAVWRYVVIVIAMVVSTHSIHAYADDRSEARTHYQAGVKFYGLGDYKNAIREFSAAQQLAPADLNNYNLALCYDKLGDAEPAIQYYRAYLDKNPGTDKRAEIEASVARLDGAAKSAAAKKAEEARKADEARQALEAKKAEEARKAEEGARRADEARRAKEAADAARRSPPPVGASDPTSDPYSNLKPAGGGDTSASTGGGGIGTPGTGAVVSTGDAQLDRVQQIDINQIRDQRTGGARSGMPDPRGGPATAAGNVASADPNAPPTAGAPNGPVAPNGPAVGASDQPAKPAETPVYKKWWFWAVIGVSAYVVISIATQSSSTSRARELPIGPQAAAPQPGGLTLMSW